MSWHFTVAVFVKGESKVLLYPYCMLGLWLPLDGYIGAYSH